MSFLYKKREFIACAVTIASIFYFLFSVFYSWAAAPDEIQSTLSQKAKELQEVSIKIKETQKVLEETQGQKKTLQQEVAKLNKNITQLTLGIRSSELTLDKLGLEINSLQYDISDIEKDVAEKQLAILKTIQEIQKKDHESPLIIFLKNQTLADSVFELESLLDLNTGLKSNVSALKNARENLTGKLEDTAAKKANIEEEHLNFKSRKIILDETKRDKQNLLKETKNQEQSYQKSLEELSKKQAEIAAQIEAIDAALRQKIDPGALPPKRPGVLGMPVASSLLTQEYGATAFAKYGYRGKWHNGVDYGASIGTPVYAAQSGVVVSSGNQDRYCYRGAYGKFLAISHDNNLTTLYGHLSLQVVSEGDKVIRGQIIGYVGRTGYATGPHLHFTVYSSPTFKIAPSKTCGPKMPYGGDLNPLDYL